MYYEPIENIMFDNFVLIKFVEISTKYIFIVHLQVDN